MKRVHTKKKKDHEFDLEGSWAISYGDLLTLLVAFFLLFFSTSPEKDEEEVMMTSLITSLSAMATPELKEVATGSYRVETAKSRTDDESMVALGAKVLKVGRKVYIDFPGVSFFGSGGTSLTEEGKSALKRFVKQYTPYAGHNVLNIVGFTDERPINFSNVAKDNWELSVLRALSAQRLLRSEGVPLAGMRIAGHGIFYVNQNSGPEYDYRELNEALARARKVVLMIEPGGAEQ